MGNKIKECRICNYHIFETLIDFGALPLGNNLANNYRQTFSIEKYPLKILKCLQCNHFQLSYSVDPRLLYATNYTYLSGIGLSFLQHIKEYVEWIHKKNKSRNNRFVFEIGSNDGTALEEFKKYGYNVLGIDPASKPVKIAQKKGVETIHAFFDQKIATTIIEEYGHPDIITSQNALAHIDDLRNVFKSIYRMLKNNGIFIFEVGYFRKVLEKNLFDTIYHEHLDYHHAVPLVTHLTKLGFDVIELKPVKSQGGSIRILLKKTGRGKIYKKAYSFLLSEKKSCLFNNSFLENWSNLIELNNKKFRDLIKTKISEGVPIIGYGAPTKATLLLHLAFLGSKEINFIVEDNSLKVDKFLPNGIPIKSFGRLIEIKERVLIVVLAWNFSEDIIRKLKQNNVKGEVLIPLPKVELKKIC
ncbi:MAG: hypothetical protein CBB97_07895 [Candidatus Endolissoclinum sp. TMED37]|nr:MAG: hypothetical protein CBB97_07895 [Candidatus Endolissoclinum sp. TMED37]|tara:strand:+ start:3035 stop:4276 length:1242 start_codon:yes stop_codon:yes gene_type:complete